MFEVVDGRVGGGETDVVEVRQQFGGVRALELNDQIALEAARMQDKLMDNGERMAVHDLLIAVTARSMGDELVVSDNDIETGLLKEMMDVTGLGRDN